MAPITHIVLFKYRSNIAWSDLERHFEEFAKLKTECVNPSGKPYMLSMKAGKNHSWEPYAKGMTHAFILEFDSKEDRDYYLLKDPVHRAFSEKAGPFIEDSLVVDIEDGTLFGDGSKKPVREYDGSCHCGQIEWTVRLESPKSILCHCRTCQILSGGPYSCNQIIHKDDLKIVKGTPKIYTYIGASGNPVLCYHCPNCTSHVYHHQMIMGDKIIVRTLLLDGGDKMGLQGEIFGEGRLGWVDNLAKALAS